MPDFPQYMNAQNVEFATFAAVAAAAFPYTAANGTVLECTPTAANSVLNLPPVALGGPVTVLNLQTTTGTVLVKTTDGSEINGVAGTTGFTVAVATGSGVPTIARFASDGSNWWTV